MTRKSLLSFLFVFLLSQAASVRAGILSTNLPSNTYIVNINAGPGGNGAAGNNAGGGNFFAPFSNDPTLTLGPGTYTFYLVDPADAAAAFNGLTSAQLATVQTAWTFNNPWTTDYIVFDSSAFTNTSEPQLFDGGNGAYNEGTTYSSQQAAYDAARSQGYYNNIRVGSRLSTNFQKTYTLTSTETLVFAIPDNDLGDNAGGVSVVVQMVPEPGVTTLCVIGMGLLCLGVLRQRRARFT